MVDEWTQTRCSDASIYKRLLLSQTFQGACAVGVDAHPCLGSSEGRQGISRSSSRPALGTRPAGGSPVSCTLITAHLPLIRRQPPPLFPGLSVQKHPNRGSKSTGLARFTVARFSGCPHPHRPLWSRCGLQPGFFSLQHLAGSEPACSIEDDGAASLGSQEDRGRVENRRAPGRVCFATRFFSEPQLLCKQVCFMILEQTILLFLQGYQLQFG